MITRWRARIAAFILLMLAIVASVDAQPLPPQQVPGAASTTPVPAPASTMQQQAVTAPASSSETTVAALTAQLAEMRRSEDRLLSTVLWALGTIVALAIGLLAVNWWTSRTIHQQDLKRVTEAVYGQLLADLKRMLAEAEQRLLEKQQPAIDRLQAQVHAYTLGHVAKLWINDGNVQHSIDAALELASNAKAGNRNYDAQAVDIIVTAFKMASEKKISIEQGRIDDAHRFVIKVTDPLGAPAREFATALSEQSRLASGSTS